MIEAETGTEAERNTLLVAYVLYVVAIFTGGLAAIAGVIINHIKIGETGSEFIRSHHRWLLRTFWYGLLWMIVSTVLMVIGIGFLIYGVVFIWFVYRVIRGVLLFSERRVVPT